VRETAFNGEKEINFGCEGSQAVAARPFDKGGLKRR
jgi:hypothetical protein